VFFTFSLARTQSIFWEASAPCSLFPSGNLKGQKSLFQQPRKSLLTIGISWMDSGFFCWRFSTWANKQSGAFRRASARFMFAKRTNWNLAPNRLSAALAAHRAAGKPLLDLTVSNPTECGFHHDGSTILRALSNPAALCYEPNPKGLESARRAVAGYYAERQEEVSVEDIFKTTSNSEAYSFFFSALCNPGD